MQDIGTPGPTLSTPGIVPSHIGLENRIFSFSVSLSTRCNYSRVKL